MSKIAIIVIIIIVLLFIIILIAVISTNTSAAEKNNTSVTGSGSGSSPDIAGVGSAVTNNDTGSGSGSGYVAPPPPPPYCDKTACNGVMKDYIVNKYWAFSDSANNFGECKNCDSRWFRSPMSASKDGTNFASLQNSQAAYDYVAL